jgi:hypothetical protein
MPTNTSAPSLALSRFFAIFCEGFMRASSRVHRRLCLCGEMMLGCCLVGYVFTRRESCLLLLLEYRKIFNATADMLGLIVVS